ncbi:helix-turn-helix domain-containing protein [Psychrobacillus sp. OK032]|uniref:helix-turn-helix domain-containing protein n=1 Tax=Psychrobacillus sp. OK032 TaxID=1884358 RepID=UPI0008AFBAC8|nr:helix-turn-helix domain-containing protein [Psychrobacillus sp. OK032]SER88682.1 Helix-turn-helix domain-containing protein [Psychrobacillus sp. OK032]
MTQDTKLNVLDFQDQRFTRVTKSVINDEVHLDKASQKLVYAILCMYADNTSMKSHPSVQTLAKKACCSENTVRAALKRLEELELVKITRRRRGISHLSNEYTLLVPPDSFTLPTSI